MKKLSLLAATLMLANPASADTLLGLYAGAQGWNYATDGGFANNNSLANFAFEDETKSSFYVALEHPVPLVPNIKIRRSDMSNKGNVLLTTDFTFNNETFSSDSNLHTDIDLSSTDYILYYEFFDNDLFSFDFGLNIKDVDGDIYVVDVDDTSTNAREAFSGFIPSIYSRIEAVMPFTGLGFFVEGNYLSIDDHTMYEYQAAVTYSMMDNIAVDMTFQLGYRAFSLQLEDLDDIYTDLQFKGPFAGIEVHF
ncbi:TIGR04219 family outer membrane beta-barrel protein [Alteromonadaceae bacterium BrNp21-10]|nr:TIGR04219 family outer membrane beta-barrel protein [Alteromonadaceae bacterium BrNp21-10]